MCDCEELEYDDFVTVLSAIKETSATADKAVEPVAVPLTVSVKRKK